MTSTHIHMVRHGHVHNPNDLIYGRLPNFHLSELGRAQVAETAKHIATLNLRALYVSPMLRAQETADILTEQLNGVPRHIAEAVNEVKFELEGCHLSDAEARNWDLYTGAPAHYPQPPNVVARATAFIEELLQTYQGQSIAFVSHGDVIAFTTLWAYGVELVPANKHTLMDYGLSDPYPNLASVTTLSFNTPDTSVLPEVSYLRPYGDDLVYKGPAPK